jgi:hypothetical protein
MPAEATEFSLQIFHTVSKTQTSCYSMGRVGYLHKAKLTWGGGGEAGH